MSDIDKKKEAAAASYASKMDALKDLIFGEEYAAIRESLEQLAVETDQRFNDLSQTISERIDTLEQNINHKIDTLSQELNERINKLEANTNKAIEKLDDKKADRLKLGRALEKIGKSLQE